MRGLLPALVTVAVLSIQCSLAAESKSSGPRGNVELLPSVSRYLGRTPVRPPPTRHQRRLPQSAKPPPYAVQMEPLVQYSQRDPLYQASSSRKFSSGPGVLVNHHGSGGYGGHQSSLYVTPQPDYYNHGSSNPPGYIYIREPEPIIEIIVKESNETLPDHYIQQQQQPSSSKPREPVHVFFVKYKKDEHSGQVKYEAPVAAVTPASIPLSSPDQEPEPVVYTTPGPPPASTTLRTVIHPDSETVHVNTGGLKITFGEERYHGPQHSSNHQHGNNVHHEHHEQQGSEPQPSIVQTPEQRPHQQIKRQQPAIPAPRFHFPPSQSRFLTPPPVHGGDFRSAQFSGFPQFQPRPSFNNNQPQFSGKGQNAPFQQSFESFQQPGRFEHSGKLEAVPFKQPSTGKLVVPTGGRFETSSFSQPPSFQPNFRHQEPLNGLPPPPPQSFQRQPPPTFFSTPQRAQPRPPPSGFSQPSFSQPINPASFPQPSFPQSAPAQTPSFPQAPPPNFAPSFPKSHSPSFSQPLPPNFSPLPNVPQNFSPQQNGPTSPQPVSSTPAPLITRSPIVSRPIPASNPTGPEIVQSLSPSTAELQRQQQEQFRREQEYYQEIQKLQQEIDERGKTSTTPSPPPASRQQPQVNTTPRPSSSTTTPATPVSTTGSPNFNNLVLPDEVPDDLRQQLLASGILNNADIQILDYDKVGDIPIESLPQEALQQFVGATGGQVPAASENRPQYVPAPVDRVSSVPSAPDSDTAASEQVGSQTEGSGVEVKVVRFPPGGEREAASKLVREDATTLQEPVVLDDASYARYLPLQVAGARFPLPDVPELRGRNITSVVVLAPVETQNLHAFSSRSGNVAEVAPEEVQFVAGHALTDLVANPTEHNFKRWLRVENSTEPKRQSVILLVADKEKEDGQDVFMFDVGTQKINKLDGELSAAFVEVALANSSTHDPSSDPGNDSPTAPSEPQLSISSSYSKTKQ